MPETIADRSRAPAPDRRPTSSATRSSSPSAAACASCRRLAADTPTRAARDRRRPTPASASRPRSSARSSSRSRRPTARSTRRFGGTGLGLTISRRLRARSAATSWSRSTLGEGSTFTVASIPVRSKACACCEPRSSRVTPNPAVEPRGRWKFPPARVLVVDDGRESRARPAGAGKPACRCRKRKTAGRSRRDRHARSFDVRAHGHADAGDRRASPPPACCARAAATVPIIALTANVMKGFEQELTQNGFSSYLTKPIKINDLLAECAAVVGREETRRAPRARAGTADAPKSPREGARSRRLAARVASGTRAGGCTFRAGAAREDRGDGDRGEGCGHGQLAALAHWLKGSGGTMGFDGFFVPARVLEHEAKAGTRQEYCRHWRSVEGAG